jgi:hypothetical protein
MPWHALRSDHEKRTPLEREYIGIDLRTHFFGSAPVNATGVHP